MSYRVDEEMRAGGYVVLDGYGRVAVVVTQRDTHPVHGQGVSAELSLSRARICAEALNKEEHP